MATEKVTAANFDAMVLKSTTPVLVDLCHPIEPYQVTKNLNYELGRREQEEGRKSCLLSPVS